MGELRGPRVLGVIPARWESSRFPGKVLAPLAGRPVLAHVVEAVQAASRVDAVLVATDEPRVMEAAAALGVDAVLTLKQHASGTDRIGEAIADRDAEIILNIQGDEALVPSVSINRLVAALERDAGIEASTLACPLDDIDRTNPNVVKVVTTESGRALYFSRSDIPAVHPTARRHVQSLRHIGLYAYRRPTLERFLGCGPTGLELQEGLEQLRLLEAGAWLEVAIVEAHPAGVDTPEDLVRCERILARGDAPL